jgi:hypothetical protein
MAINLIIAINSNNVNAEYVSKLSFIYSKLNPCIGIMGTDSEKILESINNKQIVKFLSPSPFNYSICINKIMSTISAEDTVIISDGYALFNQNPIIEMIGTTDLDSSFIVNKIIRMEPDAKPLSFDSNKIISALGLKIKHIKTPSPDIPLVITKGYHIIRSLNGLEETYQTEASRLNIIYKLSTYGLSKIECDKPGLCINQAISSLKYDETTNAVNMINDNSNGEKLFIQNNYKKEIFNVYLESPDVSDPVIEPVSEEPLVVENITTDIPETTEVQDHVENVEVVVTPFEGIVVEQIVATDDVLERPLVVPSSNRSGIPNLRQHFKRRMDEKYRYSLKKMGSTVLLAMESNIPDIISTSPLISFFNKNGYYVDVLTQQKIGNISALIDSSLIRNRYDVSDMTKNNIPFKSYVYIIKTSNCNIKLPVIYPTLNCKSGTSAGPVEENFKILDYIYKGTIRREDYPPPCIFTPTVYPLNPKTIFLCTSQKTQSRVDINFDEIANNLVGKYPDIDIIQINLKGETPYPDCVNKKITDHRSMSVNEIGGYLKKVVLTISSCNSDLPWICYGLGTGLLLFGPNISQIPNYLNVKKVATPFNTNISLIIDKICPLS